MSTSARRAVSEKRLSELGTANWNNRGIDCHIKRPAGSSSAALKQKGSKRIDIIPNQSHRLEDSLKYPTHCLFENEHLYDGCAINHVPAWPRENPAGLVPAGQDSVKTVHLHNHGALADKERDGPEGGKVPNWLIGAQTKKRVEAPYQFDHDPVQHNYVQPHPVGTRPMRKTGFDHAATKQNWVLADQQQYSGPYKMHQLSKKEYKKVAGIWHVGPTGDALCNLCGTEDLKPVAHKDFVKGDRPATALQQYENDSRLLAYFERDRPNSRRGNPQLESSCDMKALLFGQAAASKKDNSRSYEDGSSVYSGSTWAETTSRPQARSPRQSGSFASSDRGGRRSARSSDGRSVRSSYYYSEGSESRRSKSVERMSTSRRSDGGSAKTPRSGMFSDPSRTVSVNALTQALKKMESQSPRRRR